MVYQTKHDLPDSVQNSLPAHAQDIYKAAFNNAIKEYNKEETAHKVAWNAVKQKYEKNNKGEWIEK